MGRRSATVTEMPLRREPSFVEDYSESGPEDDFVPLSRRPGVRVSFTGRLIPTSIWGRIGAGCGLALLIGGAVAAVLAVHSFLLHDPHFVVESSSAVEIAGNSHLSRPQLLSVFGGDVERNIFRIPLDDRRAQLEGLPWVEHATVMRLLPDHIRIAIEERTPVAFVRQGNQIGLVDAGGVLLDFGSDISGTGQPDSPSRYSFPVVTGISQSDPLSTRAARMRIYQQFLSALDAQGEGISHKLSEVDLSDPEDIKALLPDGSGNSASEVLVHFGDDKYLDRYHRYQEHLAEWRQQYPRLSSVDLRYEQQVVLDMKPGADPAPADAAKDSAPAPPRAPAPKAPAPKLTAAKPAAAKPAAHPAQKPAPAKQFADLKKKPAVPATPHAQALPASSTAAAHHLTTSYAVGTHTKVTGKPAGGTGVGAAR